MRTPPDRKAEDGHFYSGMRWVRAGGWVKAGGYWFQADELLPYVDAQIFVYTIDYWLHELACIDGANNFRCTAHNKARPETKKGSQLKS